MTYEDLFARKTVDKLRGNGLQASQSASTGKLWYSERAQIEPPRTMS